MLKLATVRRREKENSPFPKPIPLQMPPNLKYPVEAVLFLISRLIKLCPNHREYFSPHQQIVLLPTPHYKYYQDHGNFPCEECLITKIGCNDICRYMQENNYFVKQDGYVYKKDRKENQ